MPDQHAYPGDFHPLYDMNCMECGWPIISTIQNRKIYPQCFHKERGLHRPPTPENINKTHRVVAVSMPIDMYDTLAPIAIQYELTVPGLIRQVMKQFIELNYPEDREEAA